MTNPADDATPERPERFERHTRTFAALTLLSRVTGLGREAAFSRVFGASAVMDAFFFAFLIPNLFRRLFGEGAMSAAFLRAYARLERSDRLTAGRLATLTAGMLLAVLGGLTLLAEIGLWLAARHVEGDRLVLRLVMIMLPYMPLVCLVAVLGAMLQVHGRFAPTAAAPILLNLALIATVVAGPLLGGDVAHEAHITIVAAAVLAAGLLQLAWVVLALRGHRWLVRGAGAAAGPMRRMLRHAGPMVLGLGVLQLNTFFDGLIASYPTAVGPEIFGVAYPLREGAMSAVVFAQRLYQFPLGVFGIAVATAIYPALARQSDDPAPFAATLERGLRLVFFVGLPASAGLVLVGPDLVRVIYEGGRFGAADTTRVAFVLTGYASAVWAYSMIHVVTRAFYARGDSRTPVRVTIGMVGMNLGLNCVLIWTPLREAGLAWSTATCAVIQVGLLLALARRSLGAAPAPAASFWRTLVATGAMAAVVWIVLSTLPEPRGWGETLVNLLLAVGAGLLVVMVAARAMRMPELGWALGRT